MKILFACVCQLFIFQLHAQYDFFTPNESFAIEVSLDNSTLNRLPIYRNAITSLVVSGDYIIGGTTAETGLAPFLFSASIAKREMVHTLDLETIIPGQKSIRTGFCKDVNKVLYAGTIPRPSSTSGHLIAVSIDKTGNTVVKDLGVPVEGEGIFSLTIDTKGAFLYGITYPTGLFFSYSLTTKAVRIYRDIVPASKDIQLFSEFVLEPEDYLCKALTATKSGLILGSAPVNRMFLFDPVTQKLQFFTKEIPEVWGRRSLGQVECWTETKSGKLYAGNAGDGQLLEVDPVSKAIKNIGKPIMMPHLRGLVQARDGKLWGIAGANPGYAHLFSYDAGKEGFKDYGNPQFKMVAPGIEQGIDWRGFQLATIAASEDGKYIVIGEDEALSQLLVFAVENK